MAAGSAALTGGGLAGIGAGAMAIGGAVGSIASQAVGNLIGAQDGFSWRSVGLSAIGGGISGGMGGWAPLGEATSTGTAVGNAMIRAAVGNVASQGIGVVTGLQSSFSWQSVAASAVGAGVGQAVGGALGMNERGFSELSFGQQFGARLLTGVAAGTAAAIARGGRVAIQQVATDAFGNALGQSLAAGSGQMAGSASGTGEDRLGAFIEQNQGSWNQRQADYDQMVDAFGNPTAYGRDDDVLVSAAGGLALGRGGVREAGTYVKPDGTRVMVLDATGEAPSGSAARSAEPNLASRLYASGAGDVRGPFYSQANPSDPFVVESSTLSGQGLRAPDDGFWRGLSGEGRSVLEGSASFGENLGLTVNGLVTGPVRAAYSFASEIGNQYADAYNLLTRDGASYVPSSALASSLQRNGIGSTLASMGESMLSSPTKPIFDLLEGNYRAAGEGLLGTAAMGMGAIRGLGSGLRLGSTTGLSFEDALVLRGDASRAAIVQAIGDAAQPSIEALLRLDPSAQIGFRGSLADGLKNPLKLGANGERVAFDGFVSTKGGIPYTGLQGYDADFFVVSDKLADRLGNKRWMDAARLDQSLSSVFKDFGATMQENPLLSGMKHSEGTTFRVWSQEDLKLKTPAGDPQYYFLRGGAR